MIFFINSVTNCIQFQRLSHQQRIKENVDKSKNFHCSNERTMNEKVLRIKKCSMSVMYKQLKWYFLFIKAAFPN